MKTVLCKEDCLYRENRGTGVVCHSPKVFACDYVSRLAGVYKDIESKE